MCFFQYPWDSEPAPREAPEPPPAARPQPPPKRRGRRPAGAVAAGITAPPWLYHHLTISGPAEPVAAFAAAARGAGIIPWRLDFAALEEDLFHLAASQPPARRSLSIEGCRILARQFRERVEARQAKAASLVERSLAGAASKACPFDLQVLLPVPAAILQLGPTHPAALAWLSAHWGVADRLRQVVERPKAATGRRLPPGHAVIGYGFFTADETPHAAIAALGTRFPGLRFVLRPRPAD